MIEIDEEIFFRDLETPIHLIDTFPNGNSLYLGHQQAVGGFPDRWAKTPADYENALQALRERNILAIYCCADFIEDFREHFKWGHTLMESNADYDILPACRSAWEFIDQNLQHGSVFVHCNAGCHRSATIVVGYLAWKLNISVKESLKLVKSIRSCIDLGCFRSKLEEAVIKWRREKSI